MGELAKSVRAALEALQDPRNRIGLARLYQPKYIVLAPALRTGTEVKPRGKPVGVFEYPEDLERVGLRIPKGWCVVYTDNSSYAQRKYAITLEKARHMSDEELEAVLLAQAFEFARQGDR